ncbi:MAG: hypothetical protein QXX92_06745 [Candidatus Bathyarchaeia archaeon]
MCRKMGYVRVRGFIANPLDRNLKEELEFIVNTPALFTRLFREVLLKGLCLRS